MYKAHINALLWPNSTSLNLTQYIYHTINKQYLEFIEAKVNSENWTLN